MSKKREIYNNYDLWEKYTDEDMLELALANDMIEDGDEATDEILDNLRYDEDAIEWENVWGELKRFFKDKEVIFFGNVGRWDGTYAGGKTGEFEKLYHEAVRDCMYVNIYEENGHMYLECSHHDGTNFFEIKEVTDKGKQYLENWEYSYNDKRTLRDVHTNIINRYSRRPQFCKCVWDA